MFERLSERNKKLQKKKYDEYKKIILEAIKDYNSQNYKSALKKFKKMSEINYDNTKIHEILAYLYIKLNSINKADEELDLIKEILNKNSSDQDQKLEDINNLIFDENEIIILKKEYEEILKQPKSYNFSKEFKVVKKLSDIYLSTKQYKEAENVLDEYKKKFFQK